jgi:hypothetical protein
VYFQKGPLGIFWKKFIVRVRNAYDFTKSTDDFEQGREAKAFEKAEATGLFLFPGEKVPLD